MACAMHSTRARGYSSRRRRTKDEGRRTKADAHAPSSFVFRLSSLKRRYVSISSSHHRSAKPRFLEVLDWADDLKPWKLVHELRAAAADLQADRLGAQFGDR